MTEDEVKQVMRACGWSYLLRQRKGRYWYVYAQRHLKTGKEEKYIGSVAAMASLTVEELKHKLGCTSC